MWYYYYKVLHYGSACPYNQKGFGSVFRPAALSFESPSNAVAHANADRQPSFAVEAAIARCTSASRSLFAIHGEPCSVHKADDQYHRSMHAAFRLSSQDAQREGGGRRDRVRRQEDRGVDCFVRTVSYPQVPALMDLVEDPPFPCWPPAPFIVIIKNWAFCHLFTLFLLLQRIPVERNWARWAKSEKGYQPASTRSPLAISQLPSPTKTTILKANLGFYN